MLVFTTKTGTEYSLARVTKLHRDGITILHDGGESFIHRDELTDSQKDKYQINWITEVLVPTHLIHYVDSAMRERDHDLEVFTTAQGWRYEKLLSYAKFDFERESFARSYELNHAATIHTHRDRFKLRLFELAYAAQDFGQREAMKRIERELSEPLPEPYKARAEGIERENSKSALPYIQKLMTCCAANTANCCGTGRWCWRGFRGLQI